MAGEAIQIGELSRRTGCNIETIRYYERIGLMPAPPRTDGGHRSYASEHVQRLRFIRRSRELGFGLDAIRRLIALSEPGIQGCREVRDMAREHVASIDARIADLQRLRGVLQQAASDCREGETVRCPIIEELGG